LGWIPEDWEIVKVKDLVKRGLIEKPMDGNHGNDHPTSSDFVSDGIPFITANCLSNGKILYDIANKITKKQADKLRKGHSKKGDVLLSHKGSVGDTAIVGPIAYDYIMLTPQVTYYRVKRSKKIVRDYIKHFFDSARFQNILRILSGGGTRSYIGITKQRDLPFLLPPYTEQKKIAEILSTWDRAIETLEQLIAKKEELKKGLMQQLLTGEKRFPGFEGEWKKLKTGKLFDFLRSISVSRKDLDENNSEESVLNLHYGDLHVKYNSITMLDVGDSNDIPFIVNGYNYPSNIDYAKDGDVIIVDASEDYEGVGECVELKNVGEKKLTAGLHTFC
jgi:type I restriction enzyme, S subunit